MAVTDAQIDRLRRLVNEPYAGFAADADGVHAAIVDTGSQQVLTTGITQPTASTFITATSGGTAADIGAVRVMITGTDEEGRGISETLPAFVANAPSIVQSAQRFRSVVSITVPAHDGLGATTAIGWAARSGYSDDDLEAAILRYPVVDENGQAPRVPYGTVGGNPPAVPNALVDNPLWTATYDMNAAAGDIWEEKAAVPAETSIDFVGQQDSFKDSQTYEQCMKQARYFRSRRSPRTMAARPEPLDIGSNYIINQPEAD